MWIERVIALGLVILSAFLLGLIADRVYCHRKNKLMREELKRLRNWKESTKGLCDKLKDGEEKADYLPEKLEDVAPPMEEDDDTKTGELKLEKVIQGHPRDF